MAFSALFLENLVELKTRRGNSTDTTIATVLGLYYPPDEALAFYRWFNLSTDTPDDYEIVQPTVGGILTGRWVKIDMELTVALIITALGYTPYDAANPAGYISSFTETDPNVPPFAKSLTAFSVIKALTDPLYKSISYVPAFVDITSKPTTISGYGITDFNSLGDSRWSLLGHTHTFSSLTSKPNTLLGYGINDAYPLTGNPSGFLTSFTELDPTVPSYSKSLTAFSVIKSSTDPLYKAIGYTPTSAEVTTALGFTPYNSSNPNSYINQSGARSAISLTTTGTGSSTYNNTTGVLNIPTPVIPTVPVDYTNTAVVAGGAGNTVFYLTNDKTSTGTALYTNINYVNPIINDSSLNYSYSWTYNAGTKALTVNSKAAVGLNISLLGLTLLGVPSNVANGVSVQVLVKGN